MTRSTGKKLRLMDYKTLEDLHRGWILLKLREQGGSRTKTAKAVCLTVQGLIFYINKYRKQGYEIPAPPLRGSKGEEQHTIKSGLKSNIRKDVKSLANELLSTFSSIATLERVFFLLKLREHNGNRKLTRTEIGLSRTQFYRRLHQYEKEGYEIPVPSVEKKWSWKRRPYIGQSRDK